ncbi:response regulator transcription factor [Mahella sp.]|uniref:response regulator transcription factor n=1 Tax=Mahella sp. TaxID=2798721 RepID=UPI0025C10CE7|nr:response regulator transcription factor [Mahella sp.]MBZ4665999.1 two component transcriptional regulator, winged helix family [Mahella sp.]
MAGFRIMVVEDEERMRQLLYLYMQNEGFEVLEASDGQQALELFEQYPTDLVILDVMLPHVDGWTVCRQIRQASQVPIIMLTARGEENDKLFGFDLGVDDYVVKPFSPKELVARVKALLKRSHGNTNAQDHVIRYGNLSIEPLSRRVAINDQDIILTPKEFDLLFFMASHPGQVFSREQLLHHVWGYDFYGDSRTVDAHVKNLRAKLGDYGRYIATVWGVGYKFDDPV